MHYFCIGFCLTILGNRCNKLNLDFFNSLYSGTKYDRKCVTTISCKSNGDGLLYIYTMDNSRAPY